MKETTTSTGKPLLDADSFQKLLAAAYVLQEHRGEVAASEPAEPEQHSQNQQQADRPEILETDYLSQTSVPADYSQTLAQIVATQQQIHRSQLPLEEAMKLIADRTRQIARATGAAITLLQNEKLVYRAASGSASAMLGSEMQADSCLSSRSFQSGESYQCANTVSEANAGLCRRYGIKAFITVPVFYEGKVAGTVELHSASPNAFREPDVRTCQLMAGLVTEAMARAAEVEWKQTLAAERASMLQALDRLKPQLQRLAESDPVPSSKVERVGGTAAAAAPALQQAIPCDQCGTPVEPEQLFCGECGAEQLGKAAGDLQSKWASMWDLSQSAPVQRPLKPPSAEANDVASDGNTSEVAGWENAAFEIDSSPQNSGVVNELAAAASSLPAIAHSSAAAQVVDATEVPAGGALLTKSYPWTSASKAKQWLDTQRKAHAGSTVLHLWSTRRADIYLALAILLGVIAIPWMIWSKPGTTPAASSNAVVASSGNSPARTAARRRKPEAPKLTMMEQLLVSLGLAEPPEPPVYTGNPNAQVWVDLHTAIYYCAGSELYGKTPKGKFTTQRDAQMDQFEPAYRQACD